MARAAALLDATPGAALDLPRLARKVGTSARTLSRLWSLDTGLSFAAWRQQLRLLAATQSLAAGASVLEVALELGYESPSAFGVMFKRTMGCSPARFFRRRKAGLSRW